jgi:hypothetical protein
MTWRPLLTVAKPRAGKGANDNEPGAIGCHNVDVSGCQWLFVRRDGDAVTWAQLERGWWADS